MKSFPRTPIWDEISPLSFPKLVEVTNLHFRETLLSQLKVLVCKYVNNVSTNKLSAFSSSSSHFTEIQYNTFEIGVIIYGMFMCVKRMILSHNDKS